MWCLFFIIIYIWFYNINNVLLHYITLDLFTFEFSALYVSNNSFRFMVFNATFNNISAISWWSDLDVLVVETGENHRPAASHWQTFSHNVISGHFILELIAKNRQDMKLEWNFIITIYNKVIAVSTSMNTWNLITKKLKTFQFKTINANSWKHIMQRIQK
jgi:hypothetical protein